MTLGSVLTLMCHWDPMSS